MAQFKRIGHRLIVAVGSVVLIGILAIALTYAIRQETALMTESELAFTKLSDSVVEGLTAVMIAGHAKIAPEFTARLKNIPNAVDYRVLRPNGTEAFVDNSTVDEVNNRLDDLAFIGRKGSPPPRVVLADTDPNLKKVRETGERVFFYQTLPGGERQVTTLSPIMSREKCERCHGETQKVRGVVKLTSSLKELDQDVERTWHLSLGLIAAALAGIVGLIYWAAHRTVVAKIIDFSRAMETAATGDMSVRLPDQGKDELGHMARSFNQMNEELLEIYAGLKEEKNKLNTIILGANSGIVVTDAKQHIVLVNKAAETILGKDASRIIEDGFLKLFDDPSWMESRLALPAEESAAALLDWQDKVLSVQASSIFDSQGVAIGSAALIRDVTEEKRMEAKLKEQSITDALTTLHNRRHFDEVITTEFLRWKRYAQPLSVMMIDVDKFKKFNDTHGHECGDRVLSAIGGVLKAVTRPAVIPCRYGGEEMVVVMPGLTQNKAYELAESLRLKIADLEIDGLKVTVSIGVAGVPGHEVADGEALVKLADSALYVAKANGRNQVRVAAAEMPAT